MLAAFFTSGTLATGWQTNRKLEICIAKAKTGRTAGQVFANGGLVAILAFLIYCFPTHSTLLKLMIAGNLASATADTLSSELGMVFGRRFFDVITFKKSEPGPDGVISIEGSLIGIIGASLIATIYAVFTEFGTTFFIIILSGAIGNLIDSILGATLERRCLIGNNAVNFLNTLAGALVCLIFGTLTEPQIM